MIWPVGNKTESPPILISTSHQQSGRVLILENDYSNRVLFADYLEQCGYHVFPLADEQKVLESLDTFEPQVLILNLKMPFLDGFSVIQQLRSHPRWASQLAILVVSGYSLSSDKQKAYRLGANAYLTKPMLPVELSEAVANLMTLDCVFSRGSDEASLLEQSSEHVTSYAGKAPLG